MKKVNDLIGERLKKSPSSKMTMMAERSTNGHLSNFSGMFSPVELSASEKELLESLLASYTTGEEDLSGDFRSLSLITSEVKAINNQAAMLHGERIKRAHIILKDYKDGAFTAWLMATYGNRQTPYNLMQYYEFHEALSKDLQLKLETMPRQAVYTLASREGAFEKKLTLVKNYQGETKEALLALIRELFPLAEKDKRRQNFFEGAMLNIDRLRSVLAKAKSMTTHQKGEIKEELASLKQMLDSIKTR